MQGMLDTLLPLHQNLESGPTTTREESFHGNYNKELEIAHDCLKTYVKLMKENNKPIPCGDGPPQSRTRNNKQLMNTEERFIVDAWDHYYLVFKRINQNLPHITGKHNIPIFYLIFYYN